MRHIFKITVLALVLFASCEDDIVARYTVTTTDDSGQIVYAFHTDSIWINRNGSISFVPKEDTTVMLTLAHYSIDRH